MGRVDPAFDHLMYGGPDLDALVAGVEARTGVRAAYGGRHTGAGTHAALLGLGGKQYLELIAPVPDEPPASPLAALLAGLDASRMILWVVRTSDIERAAERAVARGYDPGGVMGMSRPAPDGTRLSWRLTFGGADVALGVVPFLIQWEGRAHPAVTAPQGCTLLELRAEHPEPDRIRAALAALDVALRLEPGPEPLLLAELDTPRGRVILR